MESLNEEKKIQIEPLKKKVGRPPNPNKKPKIETHVMTPARQKTLEKARVVKRMKAEERKAKAAAATATTVVEDPVDRLSRVEMLLSKLLESQDTPVAPVFSQNPYLARRYK